MTHPAAVPAAVPPRDVRVAGPARPALDAPLARRVLGHAILLGITADTLLRGSILGLAFPAWVALAALTLVSLTWSAGRRLSAESAAWLLTAVVFAATMAWRDSELLDVAGFLATAGALLMAAVSLHRPGAALLAARVRDLLWEATTRLRTGAVGLLPFAWGEASEPGEGEALGRKVGPAARAGAIAAALVLVFGALLRGADPIFASLVDLPDLDIGTMMSHVVFAGFAAWVVSGWARAALDRREPTLAPVGPPWTLGPLEITTALGALNALFAVYVLTQLGWFFGGERFLHERTGLTAAEYARAGFFQVVWVVMLVVPLLLATRAMLAPGRELARRHTALSLPLIGLLGAIIVSAASRMRLYVHYYGLTTDRFYTMAFMGWLVVVLAWLAWTVLRGRGERFVAGALGSALAVLLLLDIAAPDTIVARVNIARAERAPVDAAHQLDLIHLARLSGDASPLAVAATLAPPRGQPGTDTRVESDRQRCGAAEQLIMRRGPESSTAFRYREDGAWRIWNAGEATALRTVAENAPALRAVHRDACRAWRLASPKPAAAEARP